MNNRKAFVKDGFVIIHADGSIVADGFVRDPEHRDGHGSCRDHVRAVLVWALDQITKQLAADSAHNYENYRASGEIFDVESEAKKLEAALSDE